MTLQSPGGNARGGGGGQPELPMRKQPFADREAFGEAELGSEDPRAQEDQDEGSGRQQRGERPSRAEAGVPAGARRLSERPSNTNEQDLP